MIQKYVKSDGTVVRSHFRLPAGARRETALLGLFVAGAWVLGHGTTTAGTGTEAEPGQLPRPKSSVVYPIQRPGWDKVVPPPAPTVSYPIKFPASGGGR
ncbi:hypothetical protein [Streptomyces sp. NPDC060031]|uniref:hypothetical protein n=1 Tax=Streptomyces sp. NPDC060031 TaxID=3347043 RepID=UPI0036B8A102